jgi:hypothetical protein
MLASLAQELKSLISQIGWHSNITLQVAALGIPAMQFSLVSSSVEMHVDYRHMHQGRHQLKIEAKNNPSRICTFSCRYRTAVRDGCLPRSLPGNKSRVGQPGRAIQPRSRIFISSNICASKGTGTHLQQRSNNAGSRYCFRTP